MRCNSPPNLTNAGVCANAALASPNKTSITAEDVPEYAAHFRRPTCQYAAA